MKQVSKGFILLLTFFMGVPFAVAGGDAAAGKAKAAACGGCHGVDGNSPSASFPKLADLGEKYLIKQMQDIKSGARPVLEMTGQLDNLSDQDIADIAAYFDSNPMQISGATEKEWPLEGLGSEAFLKLGEKVYRNGNPDVNVPACTGCHSPSGKGNVLAGYPKLGGQYADYTAKQLRDFRSNARKNDGDQRTMRSIAQYMSDKEIEAVANYISGLY